MIRTGLAATAEILGRAHLAGADESPAPERPVSCGLVCAYLALLVLYPRPVLGGFKPARN